MTCIRNPGLVVVVDDDPDVLEIVSVLLEDEGYTLLCLESPARAVALGHEHQPCLFILDLTLPEMTGIDLARRLQQADFGGVPMLAISASSVMLKAARDSLLFQATIPKPFELDAFLESVKLNAA